MIRVVSSFGLYLGTVSPPHARNYAAWSVAVATDKLERIPRTIETIIGGIRSTIRVLPIKWVQAPIYSDIDMPVSPPEFPRPRPVSPDSSDSSERIFHDNDEVVHMPRWMVLQLCKDKDPQTLPINLQEYLANTAIDGGDGGATEDGTDHMPLDLSFSAVATENPRIETNSETPKKVQQPDEPEPSAHKETNNRDRITRGKAGPGDSNEKTTPNSTRRKPQEIIVENSEDSTMPAVVILKRGTLPVTSQGHAQTPTLVESAASQPQRILDMDTDSPRGEENGGATNDGEASKADSNRLLFDTCPQRMDTCPKRTPKEKDKLKGAADGPSKKGLKNPKRKTQEGAGPSKKRSEKEKKHEQRAEIRMGLDGMYKIHLTDSTDIELADQWGMLPEQVRKEIQRDNQERMLLCSSVLETQMLETQMDNQSDEEIDEELGDSDMGF